MSSTPRSFVLPDLLALCPFKASINPHHASAAAASSAWVDSYRIFPDRKRAAFTHECYELLVSYVIPNADHEHLRMCCDFVNLLFVIDEVSDEQDSAGARRTGDVFLNALRTPGSDDGSALAKMTIEFRARLLQCAGPGCVRRFFKHCEDYIDAVAQEAELRGRGVVLDMASYEALRRENSATRPCLVLTESCLGIELPDEVLDDPTFMSLYWAAVDMINWSNDIYSYNMEQAAGMSGNNVVTVLMHDEDADVQTAADRVGSLFETLMDRFLQTQSQLPSWGSAVDQMVQKYVKALEYWIVGNIEWSFDTQRYFGPLHAEIKRTRVVPIRPRGEYY
ncbi:isoprenoid synthase domain-containing protein [Fomitopsis serialis]|uniref:isoprenoid synthase domain-containing protein n=1 Tax=Fomitopsis serialis TaxID=139415 RepID=UPI00200898EC|nr:isoprenoid synthase domain-containing protein [Neoantrodia serialis]KAH9925105.1 isoprenoid synthase domain-containing protein [Neoantrodia serialis]